MRPPVVSLAALVGIVGIAACSGGQGTPAASALASGPYTYSAAAFSLNNCNFAHGNAAAYNGSRQTLGTSGAGITFEGADPILPLGTTATLTATVSGQAFLAPTMNVPTDWTTTAGQISSGINPPLKHGFACQELDTYALSGSITGNNQFTRLTDVNFTLVSGTAAECIAAINTLYGFGLTQFPCESKLSLNGAM